MRLVAVLALAVVLALVAVVVALVARPALPGADQEDRTDSVPPPAAAGPVPVAAGPVVRAAAVLRDWDERRARAWAEGDVAALRDLYVDRAGVADARLLRRYTERGYRVAGLTTQLLAVEVLGHAPGRWRLRVTDRVVAGLVVGEHERARLPRDQADTRVVRLVREADGTWRVAQVRPARR